MNLDRSSNSSWANDPAYVRLKSFVIDTTGMVFYAEKDEELVRIIDKRLKARGESSYADYLDLLSDRKGGKAELDELIAELTIGETYFFRYGEQFDALRDIVLPKIIEKNTESRRLRIWSAGCATGAEPYSLAIMLRHEFAGRIAGWKLDIIGTDINRKFLALAQGGKFNDWALRATPDAVRKSCFKHSGKSWTIRPEYKSHVTFQYHNLVEDPFPSHLDNLFAFDLILCRNVAIYFNRKTIRAIIGRFNESLVDNGWLLVGHSEPDVELFRAFKTVNAPGTVLYRKTEDAAERTAIVDLSPVPEPEAPPTPVFSPPPAGDWRHYSKTKTEPVAPAPVAEAGPAEPAQPVKAGLDQVRLYADQGKMEEAARCCERLLEGDRLNPSVHLYHALVLEQMGKNEETEKALRKAIYLDRNFVLPHYHFGLFLNKTGDRAGASRSFSNALKLLSRMDDSEIFEDGDGISVAQLRDLAIIHLEVIGGS